MASDVVLGTVPQDGAMRDAVHVAILPMVATRELQPGEHLRSGIVDPFIKGPVRPGERYWILLYPQTVTSLRHVWEHPAFPTEESLPPKRRSEADVWEDNAHAQ